MQSALSGVQAYQGSELNSAEGGSPGSVIGVNLSWGSQSSTSTQTQTSSQSQGSQLTAGSNLTIKASEGDIRVQGSALQAGNEMLLNAQRDVLLKRRLTVSSLTAKMKVMAALSALGLILAAEPMESRLTPVATRAWAVRKAMAHLTAKPPLTPVTGLRLSVAAIPRSPELRSARIRW
ncbi:MAG: 16S rRNA endonuclease CdiA [Candidatus Erwinia impunctatus]